MPAYVQGVQPVMDAIIDYLPSPLEKDPAEAFDEEGNLVEITPDPAGKLCALAFKVFFVDPIANFYR